MAALLEVRTIALCAADDDAASALAAVKFIAAELAASAADRPRASWNTEPYSFESEAD